MLNPSQFAKALINESLLPDNQEVNWQEVDAYEASWKDDYWDDEGQTAAAIEEHGEELEWIVAYKDQIELAKQGKTKLNKPLFIKSLERSAKHFEDDDESGVFHRALQAVKNDDFKSALSILWNAISSYFADLRPVRDPNWVS